MTASEGSLELQQIDKLEGIFRQVLALEPQEDPRDVERETDDRWDSLKHVLLITAIESEFDATFSVADSLEIRSFGDAASLLGKGRGSA